MNKMEIRMPREKIAISIFFIFFILFYNKTYSQVDLNGVYCKNSSLNDFGECLTFEAKDVFKYGYSGHGGTYSYGDGSYYIVANSLILNYNKSKPIQSSYYSKEIWQNKNDSINVRFEVLDFNEKPIPYVNIIYKDSLRKNGYYGVMTNKEGSADLKLKKKTGAIELAISHFNFKHYKIYINQNFNCNVIVHLEAQEGKGVPIINQIDTLKIIELKSDYFKTIDGKNKVTLWKKRKQ